MKSFPLYFAFPKINDRDVDWYSKFKTSFKRVNEFSKTEQDKILNDYCKELIKLRN